ncbi:putative isoprenylcysteine alpha-carbonyl methylesterase ICMEL2 [Astyanax mexicanus]|uniref:Putative isoprenylcysteine alpha-carbonyl methylesterase ICMEL2 n=1 Tax=Astyanax mexicanus TaxID=7994 RepID=A0A8T2KSS5_ASTMX|nr:putative isoprenylcysteine alpha-carbonyl methylesterase ICMEL2 [Astyanax mexicanus]
MWSFVFIIPALCINKMIGIKYDVTLPVAAGALFVAIPYSISLFAQWLYGWPNKPGYKKYIEALRPRRIYRLTKAVLEMLKYLQYGKLYFQWKSWYKNVDSNNKYCVKGITYGRRGIKLDLYHSPTLGQSGSGSIPVIVFVYGGAWGSGSRSMYCLLALQMAKELRASVICPDYSIYPKGNVLNMVQDISDSLMWVRENGHSFNLNKDNIVLVGHSAGAHLCALTALFLVEGADELSIEQFQQWEIANSIKGIIGLSGVYNVMDHYQHEKMRGIEYVSPMHKAMDGKEKFDYYSPTVLIKKLNKKQLKRVPPVGLVHGTQDIIVPVESSMKFSNILTSLSLPVSLYLLPKMDHTKIVTDLMAPQRHFYHKVFDCIKQEYSKFIGPC